MGREGGGIEGMCRQWRGTAGRDNTLYNNCSKDCLALSLVPKSSAIYTVHVHVAGKLHRSHTKVYLTSPGPSEIGHNSFISQPILKPLRPVDSSLPSESSDICH